MRRSGEDGRPSGPGRVVVDYRGSLFTTYYDETRKLYFCPICGYGEDRPLFLTPEDLIAHMRTHVKRRMGTPREASYAKKGEDTEEQG